MENGNWKFENRKPKFETRNSKIEDGSWARAIDVALILPCRVFSCINKRDGFMVVGRAGL
jgi:hypothetical protein